MKKITGIQEKVYTPMRKPNFAQNIISCAQKVDKLFIVNKIMRCKFATLQNLYQTIQWK